MSRHIRLSGSGPSSCQPRSLRASRAAQIPGHDRIRHICVGVDQYRIRLYSPPVHVMGKSWSHQPGSKCYVRKPIVPTVHTQQEIGIVSPELHPRAILQNPFKHRRRGGDNDRAEGDEDAYKNPACTVITTAQHNEKFSNRNKTDNG